MSTATKTTQKHRLFERLLRAAESDTDTTAEAQEDTSAHADAHAEESFESGQPAQPQFLARDQQEELKLIKLAEELEENGLAAKFREALMQRIELQDRYDHGFDKKKAVNEANKLIKAVNKSHDNAVKGAKKREEIAAARHEEKNPERELAIIAQQVERARLELAARESEAMERSVKAYMRGSAPRISAGLIAAPLVSQIVIDAPYIGLPATEASLGRFSPSIFFGQPDMQLQLSA